MSWLLALEILAVLLIAGGLLYFWRAARARSTARSAEELVEMQERVRELWRRRNSIRPRLAMSQELLKRNRDQRSVLSNQGQGLERFRLREESLARLVEVTLRLRALGLAEARHQLPYQLSLIAHESGILEAEAYSVTDEAEELGRRLRKVARLSAALEIEEELRQLREIDRDFAELREAVRSDLKSLPREEANWRDLYEHLLELEVRLAQQQSEKPVSRAQPEREGGPASPPFEPSQFRQLVEAVHDLHHLHREQIGETNRFLNSDLPRLGYEVTSRLEEILMKTEEHRLAMENEWRERMEERLSSLERPLPPRPPVLFQSLWPRQVKPAEWQTLLVYLAAGPAGLAEAEADAKRRLRAPRETYAESTSAASRPISHGTLVTVVPELPSFRFNPPVASLLWMEDWHCAELRMQALPEAAPGTTVRGRVAFYVGPILIGENDLEVEILDPDTASGATGILPQERTSHMALSRRSIAAAYRSIFVSYAHTDSEIVDRLQAAYRALGDTYFRDVEVLRSGELWSPALLAKIREADIFQLCWSEAARASRFVEQEWRYALDLDRESFVRPMHWRKPCPDRPAELASLFFAYVEMDRW